MNQSLQICTVCVSTKLFIIFILVFTKFRFSKSVVIHGTQNTSETIAFVGFPRGSHLLSARHVFADNVSLAFTVNPPLIVTANNLSSDQKLRTSSVSVSVQVTGPASSVHQNDNFTPLFVPPKEANMTTPELIQNLGYTVEAHEVQTKDGYILTMFRIPRGTSPKYNASADRLRGPVFIQHGLLCSSDDWFHHLNPQNNLPILLADIGFDVWIGNSRGNNYSMKHISLSPKYLPFWNFGLDEMGLYDVPAIIKYILSITGENQLDYIGHSMGTTMFFIAMNSYPELQTKIRKMVSFSPLVYISNTITPLRPITIPPTRLFQAILNLMTNGKIASSEFNGLINLYGPIICAGAIPSRFCANFMFYIVGYDYSQITDITSSMITGHTPSPCSSQTITHYMQWIKKGRFQAFDYGPIKNIMKYYSLEPPLYNLTNIEVPIYAFYGANDWLSVPQDVHKTLGELKNVVMTKLVDHEQFNHVDFMYAKDVRKFLYNDVVKCLKD